MARTWGPDRREDIAGGRHRAASRRCVGRLLRHPPARDRTVCRRLCRHRCPQYSVPSWDPVALHCAHQHQPL